MYKLRDGRCPPRETTRIQFRKCQVVLATSVAYDRACGAMSAKARSCDSPNALVRHRRQARPARSPPVPGSAGVACRRKLRRRLAVPPAGRVCRGRARISTRARESSGGRGRVALPRHRPRWARATRGSDPVPSRRGRGSAARCRSAHAVRRFAREDRRALSRDELSAGGAAAAARIEGRASGARPTRQRGCALGRANSACARTIPSANRSTSRASVYT